MPNAIAILAHHDDHVLWLGGTIQRLARSGWNWTVVAMCVPNAERRAYFHHCCSIFGVIPVAMDFQDHMDGEPFSRNKKDLMASRLADATRGQTFDLAFTHSRDRNGEYWARHANHVEVKNLATELTANGSLGINRSKLAYFSYDVIHGSGTASCARLDSCFVLPLTYPELLWKCQLSQLAPDAETSLKNLCYPCPNPEGFEGDNLELPEPFVRKA